MNVAVTVSILSSCFFPLAKHTAVPIHQMHISTCTYVGAAGLDILGMCFWVSTRALALRKETSVNDYLKYRLNKDS